MALRGIDGWAVPGVGESEHFLADRHDIDRETGGRVPPPADNRRAGILGKTALPQLFAKAVIVSQRCDVTNHVDVIGGADGRRSWVCYPEMDRRAANEYDIVQDRLENVRGQFEL
jgi:hypothetical protein